MLLIHKLNAIQLTHLNLMAHAHNNKEQYLLRQL